MTRSLFSAAAIRVSPPWLRRTVGGKLMLAFGDVFDDLVDKSAAAVKLRFPTDDVDEDALALIGRERRIRRGPGESATTYARRLRTWWDAHRRRGGPYALLEQMHAYLAEVCPDATIELVSARGSRYSMDTDGNITLDSISPWGPSVGWANQWIFIHVSDITETLVDGDGDDLVDDAGDFIGIAIPFVGVLDSGDEEVFKAIPRDWTAAHILTTTIVLLWGTGRVLGYPPEAELGDGYVLGADLPLIFTTEP